MDLLRECRAFPHSFYVMCRSKVTKFEFPTRHERLPRSQPCAPRDLAVQVLPRVSKRKAREESVVVKELVSPILNARS